jgi:hypothetical protein
MTAEAILSHRRERAKLQILRLVLLQEDGWWHLAQQQNDTFITQVHLRSSYRTQQISLYRLRSVSFPAFLNAGPSDVAAPVRAGIRKRSRKLMFEFAEP